MKANAFGDQNLPASLDRGRDSLFQSLVFCKAQGFGECSGHAPYAEVGTCHARLHILLLSKDAPSRSFKAIQQMFPHLFHIRTDLRMLATATLNA